MIIRSLFSFSVVFLLMLTIITSVHAESEESVIEIYDKDQNLVKVIEVTDQPVASSDELNGMSDEASIQSAQRYVFGRTTFSNFVWLNGGTYYRNPGLMAMEVENRPEAFAVQLYHQGSYAGEAVWRNVSG
ncbi:hypothetical protein, partial [Aerococcus viridans]|uniref:hypothetical protein n=1 Tax=Aerococcus viridans TaxID=1377 RepID=UPI002DBB6937